MQEITNYTNVEIQLKIQRPDVKPTLNDTTLDKDNHLSTDELFDSSYSRNRYVAAMSRDWIF